LRIAATIAVPIVVGPIEDTVVVMVPRGLFFAPETLQFLVNIKCAIVVIIVVLTIRNTIVVIVNVVEFRE
jgi:hypothetical protein